MLTKSGMGMAAGLALCLVGLIGIVVTVRLYLHRGPLLSAAYFAAPKEEREKLKTQKAYRYAGEPVSGADHGVLALWPFSCV